MEPYLYTFLHFVRSVYTSMPVGLQACVVYSFSAVGEVEVMLLEKLAIGISWLPDGVAVAVSALGALLLVFLFVKIVLLVVEFIKGIADLIKFWK